MAKAKTAAAPKKVKKAVKAVRAVAKVTPKPAKKKAGKKKAEGKGVDMLWKLAEHPLVGELLAIGATAAVAAIAEAGGDKGKNKIASKSVKEAGKAAAAAIGARLISEFANGKKASKPSKPKPAKS